MEGNLPETEENEERACKPDSVDVSPTPMVISLPLSLLRA